MSDQHFFTPEFEAAVQKGISEYNRLDALPQSDDDDYQLVSLGVKHNDVVLMTDSLKGTYGHDLRLGSIREANLSLEAIITIALVTGIYLERNRQHTEDTLKGAWDDNWLRPGGADPHS